MNPHNWMTRIDATIWQCQYCEVSGILEMLGNTECSHAYPPCSRCGQTPTCAPDCIDLADLLLDEPLRPTAGGDGVE